MTSETNKIDSAESNSTQLENTSQSVDDIPPENISENTTEKPEIVGFKFFGSAGEFFKIWITNLALTIITLGIYSAWAKVRQNQYMFSNAQFAEQEFQYLAKPLQVLKGRLIAFSLLITYLVLSHFYPTAGIGFMLVLILLMPVLVVLGMRFNYHNISHRNIRFRFSGTIKGAYWNFLVLPFLSIFTLFLLYPYVLRNQHKYIVDHISWGDRKFKTEAPAADFYIAALAYLGFSTLLGLGFMAIFAIMAFTTGGASPENFDPQVMMASSSIFLVGFAAMYLGFFWVIFYCQAMMTKSIFTNASMGANKVISKFTSGAFANLMLTNTLAILFTLGLAYPWAKIRKTKYILDVSYLELVEPLEDTTQDDDAMNSATGEEVVDSFDLEVGFGV